MVAAARTTSQILLHMGVAFTVMWAVTGSTAFGGIAALVEPVCNVILMPLHDRLWRRLQRTHGEWQRARTAAGSVQEVAG
jgi:uncharacterized membrane protein